MAKRILAAGLGFALAAGVALTVHAQAKPETLLKQRQAAMTLLGKYFGPLGAMAQGRVPYDAEVVRRNAGYVDNLSRMPWDGFHPSTKGLKSRALPAVYSESDKFREAAQRLEEEASKLASVSRSGDESAVKAQIGAVGKACGSCHDDFREKQ